MTVPIEELFSKNCTLATLRPTPAVAFAVTVTGVPAGSDELAAGLEIETVGAADTVTETADDVTTLPSESVTRAVTDCAPVVVGASPGG